MNKLKKEKHQNEEQLLVSMGKEKIFKHLIEHGYILKLFKKVELVLLMKVAFNRKIIDKSTLEELEKEIDIFKLEKKIDAEGIKSVYEVLGELTENPQIKELLMPTIEEPKVNDIVSLIEELEKETKINNIVEESNSNDENQEDEIKKCLNFPLKEWKNIYKYINDFDVVDKKGIYSINQRIVDIRVGKISPTMPIEEQLRKKRAVTLLGYYFEIYNSGYRPKYVVEEKEKVENEKLEEVLVEEPTKNYQKVFSWNISKDNKRLRKKIDRDAFVNNRSGVPKEIFSKIGLEIDSKLIFIYKGIEYSAKFDQLKSSQIFIVWDRKFGEVLREKFFKYSQIFESKEKKEREKVNLFIDLELKRNNKFEVTLNDENETADDEKIFDYSWCYEEKEDYYLKELDKSLFVYAISGIPLSFKDKIIKSEFHENRIDLKIYYENIIYDGFFKRDKFGKRFHIVFGNEIKEILKNKFPKEFSFFDSQVGIRKKIETEKKHYMWLKYRSNNKFEMKLINNIERKNDIKNLKQEKKQEVIEELNDVFNSIL